MPCFTLATTHFLKQYTPLLYVTHPDSFYVFLLFFQYTPQFTKLSSLHMNSLGPTLWEALPGLAHILASPGRHLCHYYSLAHTLLITTSDTPPAASQAYPRMPQHLSPPVNALLHHCSWGGTFLFPMLHWAIVLIHCHQSSTCYPLLDHCLLNKRDVIFWKDKESLCFCNPHRPSNLKTPVEWQIKSLQV